MVEEQELDTSELGRYHVVVLANVARLSAAGLKNIESFVENGGGLVIFAGDQMDISWYNEHVYRAGRGLLPVPLIEAVETAKGADPFSFSQWDSAIGAQGLSGFIGPGFSGFNLCVREIR